jgi:hypothetical protein
VRIAFSQARGSAAIVRRSVLSSLNTSISSKKVPGRRNPGGWVDLVGMVIVWRIVVGPTRVALVGQESYSGKYAARF